MPIERFANICHAHNTFVIEDMAHAYLGDTEDRPLGQTGDFIIYSLPKIIGLPDGAPLIINRPDAVGDILVPHNSIMHHFYVFQQMLLLVLASIWHYFSSPIVSSFINILFRVIAKSSYRTLMKYYTSPSPMSKISMHLLCHLNHSLVKSKRRKLAQVYIDGLDRQKFIFFPGSELPLNVMMGFPVCLSNRDCFIRYLARHSIYGTCFVDKWNFIPKEQEKIFSDAMWVLRCHFLFPLHQRLHVNQAQHVVEIANIWSAN